MRLRENDIYMERPQPCEGRVNDCGNERNILNKLVGFLSRDLINLPPTIEDSYEKYENKNR